ncbi:MAG: photosystem I reaction center subunit IV [Gammaproteobacteria bacterium]|nr:MAG: photosystem I reaction center subunit IV [Gammaproteobacteria bacterium]
MNPTLTKLSRISPLLKSVVVACCMSISLPALALTDVLDTPSRPSLKATSTLLTDVARAGSRLVAVGQRGHVVYSDDQGKTWVQAKVPVSVLLTSVYFVDGRLGWATGHGGLILHTTDGGETWIKQFDGNQANQMVIAQAQAHLDEIQARFDAASEEAKEELQYELEDAQFALEDAEIDAETGPSKPLLDIWFKDARHGLAVGAYGYFFETRDGGQTWENAAPRLDNPERFHLNAIAEERGGGLFIVGEAGQIFMSSDEGQTWEMLESPYSGSLFAVSGTGNVNEVLVGGLRGHIFRSEDLGQTWERVSFDSDQTVNSLTADGQGQVLALANAGIWALSRDFGKTFRVYTREDRDGLLSGLYLQGDRLVLVGEKGIRVLRGLSKL